MFLGCFCKHPNIAGVRGRDIGEFCDFKQSGSLQGRASLE